MARWRVGMGWIRAGMEDVRMGAGFEFRLGFGFGL